MLICSQHLILALVFFPQNSLPDDEIYAVIDRTEPSP